MIEQNIGNLTPTRLRIILILGIVLLIIVSALSFWFFRSLLLQYSAEVNKAAREASISTNDIATLQKLKTHLEDNKVAVTRTKNIVADSQHYKYQDQIINDLSIYAKAAGITVASYDFSGNAATAAPAPTGSAATPDQAVAEPTTPSGLKSTSVSVTLKNPVDYKAVIRFIHAIEVNLTKMQLSGVSLASVASLADNTAAGAKNQVTANSLTIEVYTR